MEFPAAVSSESPGGRGAWWKNAVIYQIYVRSFADSGTDGVGDIRGITGKLGYLAWLGVDALWLTPVMPSPGHDNGYDVADYLAIDPVMGTLADLVELVAGARRRGIRILLDLVPNHTSIEHPWFRDERTRREYYIWSGRPNNWVNTYRQSCWTYYPPDGRYYLHSYLPEQPDLNWRNDEVREQFDRILRYWFDLGIAGFRIDACYLLMKDELLRDNPAAGPGDHMWDRNRGQRPVHNANHHEVHDVLRRWRKLAGEYGSPRLLMGATWVPRPDDLAAYYGSGDELQLPQYMQLLFTPLRAGALARAVEDWLAAVPDGQVPVWTASSHDFSRFPSRWCDGDPALIRTALTLLLTLPGSCVLYQGDELGLTDNPWAAGGSTDPSGQCREVYRAPMPWRDEPGGGFSTARPWLPLGDTAACNVAAQLADRGSVLHWTRALIRRKKSLSGRYQRTGLTGSTWAYRRGSAAITLDFRPTRPGRVSLTEVHP